MDTEDTVYVVVAGTADKCRSAGLLIDGDGPLHTAPCRSTTDGKWTLSVQGRYDCAQDMARKALSNGAELCWLTVFDGGLYAAKHDPCGVFADKAYMASEGIGGPYEFFSDEKEADKWMSDHGMHTPASCVVQL